MKLEHCPFCGGKGHISLTTDFLFVPWCDNKACILSEGTTKGFDSEEAAAQAWNNRQVEEIKSNFDDLDKEIQYRSGLAMSNFEDLLTMDSLNLALFLARVTGVHPLGRSVFRCLVIAFSAGRSGWTHHTWR